MSMYFYDETDDWPEYGIVKDEILHLEQQHTELYKKLKKAGLALESDPANEDLKAKIGRVKQKLKQVEEKLEACSSMYK